MIMALSVAKPEGPAVDVRAGIGGMGGRKAGAEAGWSLDIQVHIAPPSICEAKPFFLTGIARLLHCFFHFLQGEADKVHLPP